MVFIFSLGHMQTVIILCLYKISKLPFLIIQLIYLLAMAFRCMRLLRIIRKTQISCHLNAFSSLAPIVESKKKPKEFKTENNIIYYEDPDTFGTLSPKLNRDKLILEDEGDKKEEKYISDTSLQFQKITTRQYADLIKQYLKHKRLKEAIDVLEIRMLQEDRVKPENYIYNILIGACADIGYTKKAFKLYNDMKRRALKPTGDTYTNLFHACSNSPWPSNGLKLAKHLRELMIEKGVEPNLTNYNSMIKAFGRCGDLLTAFKIVDEMMSKGIKIRVHTYNHLLQACISDKENGLKHALIVWRKLLNAREKPNIYSFNLMLKCAKDCNFGSQAEVEELIDTLQELISLDGNKNRALQIIPATQLIESSEIDLNIPKKLTTQNNITNPDNVNVTSEKSNPEDTKISVVKNSMQLINKLPKKDKEERSVPNLLSKVLQMQQVLSLQAVMTPQDKFTALGGQEDFLREMETYSVKPDVKTFTQMLPLLENSTEAENKLLRTIKELDVRTDIGFYNMLIKNRCLRMDYDAAFEVMKIIVKEGKIRLKRFPDRKKLHLKPNIMTYGVLAMACKTKESGEKLLLDMKEACIKVNIEILGTLLRQGSAQNNFGYVLYIMNIMKDENIQPNQIFLKHLENFHDKCTKIVHPENGKFNNETFMKTFKIFSMAYKNWLKDVHLDEVLKPENPWAQFSESYPETVQRQDIKVKQPKRFYKRTKKFIKYKPTL